jgi:hypothetical protein
MNCPMCGYKVNDGGHNIIETRDSSMNKVRRRRVCRCGARFTTYEAIDLTSISPDLGYIDVKSAGWLDDGSFSCSGESMILATGAR